MLYRLFKKVRIYARKRELVHKRFKRPIALGRD
ncbi:hypothetical protein VPHD260_0212 [Vibrio phage D260]